MSNVRNEYADLSTAMDPAPPSAATDKTTRRGILRIAIPAWGLLGVRVVEDGQDQPVRDSVNREEIEAIFGEDLGLARSTDRLTKAELSEKQVMADLRLQLYSEVPLAA